jgi:hypothetical protein
MLATMKTINRILLILSVTLYSCSQTTSENFVAIGPKQPLFDSTESEMNDFLNEMTAVHPYDELPDTVICPKVTVELSLPKENFEIGEDIPVIITLRNNTKKKQFVFFDQHNSSTGGPAWTDVNLINKNTGESVLKYPSKAILTSQGLSLDEIWKYASQLNPGAFIASRFSLFDLVILKTEKPTLQRGTFEMQVNYCDNISRRIDFTVN